MISMMSVIIVITTITIITIIITITIIINIFTMQKDTQARAYEAMRHDTRRI